MHWVILPWWHNGQESACKCRGLRFNPWPRKIPRAMGQLSRCATSAETVCRTHWSPLPGACPLQQEVCPPATKSGPGLLQLRKSSSSNEDPAQPKINLKKIFNALSPSTEEWIKKMWYIYTMEYYSVIKKEQNNVICSKMDVRGDCHTEWSKSEKEKYHFYVESFLKKLYKWTYLQNRNRVTDVEISLTVTREGS